jgi:hypothetical protein
MQALNLTATKNMFLKVYCAKITSTNDLKRKNFRIPASKMNAKEKF